MSLLIFTAMKEDDLDAALAPLAAALGITHRDTIDGIFSDDDRRQWRDAGVSNHRVNELSRWLAAEVDYAAPALATYQR